MRSRAGNGNTRITGVTISVKQKEMVTHPPSLCQQVRLVSVPNDTVSSEMLKTQIIKKNGLTSALSPAGMLAY